MEASAWLAEAFTQDKGMSRSDKTGKNTVDIFACFIYNNENVIIDTEFL
jgi:hypothetical protein